MCTSFLCMRRNETAAAKLVRFFGFRSKCTEGAEWPPSAFKISPGNGEFALIVRYVYMGCDFISLDAIQVACTRPEGPEHGPTTISVVEDLRLADGRCHLQVQSSHWTRCASKWRKYTVRSFVLFILSDGHQWPSSGAAGRQHTLSYNDIKKIIAKLRCTVHIASGVRIT